MSSWQPIDVWDVETYDPDLRTLLDHNAELIASYRHTGRRMWLEREAQTRRGPMLANPHGAAYFELCERLGGWMEARTIRAWHYTRLTDGEVTWLLQNGLQPMTLPLIRTRLDRLVAAGEINPSLADDLYAASPYHQDELGSRGGKIWLTTTPHPIDDYGVSGLLSDWGGESISFNHHEGPMKERLQQIGCPRILEIALPLAATTRAYSVAGAVLEVYAYAIGCERSGGVCDLVAVEPLGPESILAVHTAGEPGFQMMGRGCPQRFVGRDF